MTEALRDHSGMQCLPVCLSTCLPVYLSTCLPASAGTGAELVQGVRDTGFPFFKPQM